MNAPPSYSIESYLLSSPGMASDGKGVAATATASALSLVGGLKIHRSGRICQVSEGETHFKLVASKIHFSVYFF